MLMNEHSAMPVAVQQAALVSRRATRQHREQICATSALTLQTEACRVVVSEVAARQGVVGDDAAIDR